MSLDNNIPKDWVKTTLGEVSIKKQYGYTESANLEQVGPKFLRITDIQNDFINWTTVPYCPISDSDLKKYKLQIGDVVIARTGNSTGATATIKERVNAVFASYLIRFQINNDIANYNYIDFLVRSKIWNGFVKSVKGGSAQGGANANDFALFPINLPPIEEQKAIAKILTAFDDKIKNLQAQNKTLETTAQTIFKEWFGKYHLDDELPEGWELRSFYSIGKFINGSAFKNSDFSSNREGLPIVKIAELKNGITDSTAFTKKVVDSKYLINNYDILFSWSGSPETSIDIFLWTKNKAILNQHTFNVKIQDEAMKGWYYFLLKYHKPLFIQLAKMKQTTGLGHVTISNLKEYKFVHPSSFILEEKAVIFNTFYKKIASNHKQIQTLKKTRDTLLPKLMSGKIRVNKYKN